MIRTRARFLGAGVIGAIGGVVIAAIIARDLGRIGCFDPPCSWRLDLGAAVVGAAIGMSIGLLIAYAFETRNRTWTFVLVGVVLAGVVALAYALSRDLGFVACSEAFDSREVDGCQAPRIRVLWFKLSVREIIVWSMIAGPAAGALLGLLIDLLTRRRPFQVTTSSAPEGPA